MELLFESRTNLERFSGHLNFVGRRPYIHPEPVLRPDTPADGQAVSIYGSVIKDGGMMRMWYHATPRALKGNKDSSVIAYAESADGINWKKPELGLVEYDGRDSNLLNVALHSFTVFSDPDSPPAMRYRATGYGNPGHERISSDGIIPNTIGYYTAHSGDGIQWALDSASPRWCYGDVITSAYHPGRRAGLTSLKYAPRHMRITRRAIHNAEFRDGKYPKKSALYIPTNSTITARL